MVGRRSADDRPMSYLNGPHIIGRCVGRPSADDRPIVVHHLSSADVSADRRPTNGRLLSFGSDLGNRRVLSLM